MSVALNPPLLGVMEADVAPLRVAIYLADQNPHCDRSLGITSMTRSLLSRFAKREDLMITQVISRSSYAERDLQNIQTRSLPFRTDTALGRLVADGLHSWLVRPKVDLWYYPTGYVPRIAKPSAPSVGTMHDTIVQFYADHYPESRSPRAFRYWIEQTKRSLLRHRCVMTVSQHTANQLIDFCDRHRIAAPPIKVTYEGSEWESYRRTDFERSDYVLHLAATAPHKRSNTLLRMCKQLQSVGVDLPKLKLIGKLDGEGLRILESISGTTLTPPVDHDQLRGLMGSALALLIPSEIEGFGLPALEAYFVRTPVCYVRGTAITEVVQDPQHRGVFDLEDTASFRRALDNVLGLTPDQVRCISDAMFELFSTARISDRVIRVMRECAENPHA